MARVTKPKKLQPDQLAAVDPFIHASLSASAGTGKTQVLTARVLRLLLVGAAPESILCLTFTKAAAAEMAERVGHQLAAWVRLDDDDLADALQAIGAEPGREALGTARSLFARVLDCPGGLRIQTIHSFCQTLLSAFPAEAEIGAGFRPIEGREEQALVERTLATLAEQSDRTDRAFLADLEVLADRMSEEQVRSYLRQCAASEGLEPFRLPEAVEPALRGLVGLPPEDIQELVARRCHDDVFDCDTLQQFVEANRTWGTASGQKMVERIEAWLALPSDQRCADLSDFAHATLLTGKGERRKVKSLIKHWPEAEEGCDRLCAELEELLSLLRRDALIRTMAAGLRAGARFGVAYAAAKRAGGLADFDDLIRWTRDLLAKPGIGEWVRFKLDRRTDHLLVDEAQDTNAAQWAIVKALVEEYWAGQGSGSEHRTLFIVGDFKQAIYGFQGTDPKEFDAAQRYFRAAAEGGPLPFKDLSITASFRSSQAVLDLVDEVLREDGPEALGLTRPLEPHRAFHASRPGSVELLVPFSLELPEAEEDDGEEQWEDEDRRAYADSLAARIAALIEEAPLLASTRRPLTAGDILVLLRTRNLAGLLVARLAEHGVPTAGVDRLTLSKPLAVRDLLSAMQFAVQPLDDLNLAALLVSPLVGWSQDELYGLAHGDRARLWVELGRRRDENALYATTRASLQELLAAADYEGPHAFLERILSGAMDGRRKLLGRLGRDKRDPIGELVAAALTFEAQESAGLQRFLHWFASGEVEVKRDPDARHNAVRVMTVHGAKGLEAPVVIIADATADPDQLGAINPPLLIDGGQGSFPVIRPRKSELCEPFTSRVEEEKERDRQEHLRLGYVALTRAAERLIVGGLQPRRGEIKPLSWHAKVRSALERLGAEVLDDGTLRLARHGPPVLVAERRRIELPARVLPEWARNPAPVEARPPRPLAPSQLSPDRESSPPPGPGLRAAAERGRLLHALFERLPATVPSERRAAALAWLERNAAVGDFAQRVELVDSALSVIEDPAHRALFAPDALAEAPIAATLRDGTVIAGTVDRLSVSDEVVRVVDFKTGRSVPASLRQVPDSHYRQMAAYAEALGIIFPGKRIEAALLYTSGPRLILLPLEDVGHPTHMGVNSNQETTSP
ncbi:double-strand break repair helicase AddA [Sphingomonas swuensis]|uniref:DNA 3'-5' helicase n=1 Tax=Sphingomonas swuensis TaxID=977800 RepID=A0ABP7SSW8_9SPHN